jgi:hypothetical protein
LNFVLNVAIIAPIHPVFDAVPPGPVILKTEGLCWWTMTSALVVEPVFRPVHTMHAIRILTDMLTNVPFAFIVFVKEKTLPV